MRFRSILVPLALQVLAGCEHLASRPAPAATKADAPPSAAALSFRVTDAAGAPAAGALVQLFGARGATAPLDPPPPVVVELIDSQALPHISAVAVGGTVSFRNSSELAHEVYSFSAPRQFAVRLAPHAPPVDVAFDRAGLVVLGCKLHGETIAYLQVSDATRSARADGDGYVRFGPMPPGDYRVTAWLPSVSGRPAREVVESVTLSPGRSRFMALTLR